MSCEKYQKALDLINAAKNKDSLWEKAICLMRLGQFYKSKDTLKRGIELSDEADFVGHRILILQLVKEEEMLVFLIKNIGEEKLKKVFEVLQKEKENKEIFYEKNRVIQEWYEKTKRMCNRV